MTEPTITVPAPLFRALCAAAQAVCDDPTGYPVAHWGTSEKIVLKDHVSALRAALGPLQEAGATPTQPLDRRYRSDAQ
jgi:hypothetical protein